MKCIGNQWHAEDYQKTPGTFFPPFRDLTKCKVSEKSNERISRANWRQFLAKVGKTIFLKKRLEQC